VAARYGTPVALIDPVDTRRSLVALIILATLIDLAVRTRRRSVTHALDH
jgi:hypothetical protein